MADSITCQKCGMTSHNASDVREGYCGNCHGWTACYCSCARCGPIQAHDCGRAACYSGRISEEVRHWLSESPEMIASRDKAAHARAERRTVALRNRLFRNWFR